MREGVCLTSKLPIERGPIESDTGVTPLYSIPWSRFVERGEIKGRVCTGNRAAESVDSYSIRRGCRYPV